MISFYILKKAHCITHSAQYSGLCFLINYSTNSLVKVSNVYRASLLSQLTLSPQGDSKTQNRSIVFHNKKKKKNHIDFHTIFSKILFHDRDNFPDNTNVHIPNVPIPNLRTHTSLSGTRELGVAIFAPLLQRRSFKRIQYGVPGQIYHINWP